MVFIIVFLFFEFFSVYVIIVLFYYKIIMCEYNEFIVGEIIYVIIYVYEFFLLLMVICYVFRVRKLLSNFKEIKYIVFIMYI